MIAVLIIFFASILAGIAFLLSIVAKFIISLLLGFIEATVSTEIICLIIGFVSLVVLYIADEAANVGGKQLIENIFGFCFALALLIALIALAYVFGGWIVVMAGGLFAGIMVGLFSFLMSAILIFAIWQESIYLKMFDVIKNRIENIYSS
ncbi:MAG: hypothetical protein E7274_03110 [Pseudobutyrivibrio ruminis]|uniref:hypothetical protein n=1 Tax=Pseudobutyrivibrio ruminis TaxID=46206 RepID=UPI0026EA644E|nr:hypothetical protein [Pseudobutyrivibrio ruminis]MBE5913035.1 hypothetical protein [Pseudobutyrivibrio ruminis]